MSFFFFFNDTATTEIYTLSLHDALPISMKYMKHWQDPINVLLGAWLAVSPWVLGFQDQMAPTANGVVIGRSEEHTSELQSRLHLVCRLLLEKKKILSCTLD